MSAMLPEAAELREILAAGLLAPSAENHHALRFVLGSDAVRLVATERAGWAALPHQRFLALLGFGAVLENLRLASGARGLRLRIEPWPDGEEGEAGAVVARLRWSADAGQAHAADPLAAVIATRHTNRRFYRRTPVEPRALQRLQAETAAVPGCTLRWLDAPAARKAALNAIRLAETERFRRRALHAELFGAIRFEAGWATPLDEWLAPAALEVEPPARATFARLRNWAWMERANRVGAHIAFGWRAGWLPCALAPHLGVVLAPPGDAGTTLLDAGRAFQRAWLAAAAEGLAFQPMAASTVLARQTPGDGWVAPAVRDALRRRLDELGGSGAAEAVMLFRLGRAAAPSAVAGRRPLEHHLG